MIKTSGIAILTHSIFSLPHSHAWFQLDFEVFHNLWRENEARTCASVTFIALTGSLFLIHLSFHWRESLSFGGCIFLKVLVTGKADRTGVLVPWHSSSDSESGVFHLASTLAFVTQNVSSPKMLILSLFFALSNFSALNRDETKYSTLHDSVKGLAFDSRRERHDNAV